MKNDLGTYQNCFKIMSGLKQNALNGFQKCGKLLEIGHENPKNRWNKKPWNISKLLQRNFGTLKKCPEWLPKLRKWQRLLMKIRKPDEN